jgi:hypothetical protein
MDNITKRQIALLASECADLEARIAAFKLAAPGLHDVHNSQSGGLMDNYDLGPEHAFGERVYECTVGDNGVAYRTTPSFDDKNTDGSGPVAPQLVMADRICQGKRAVFIRDVRNQAWLPLSSPDGSIGSTFKLLGKKEDVNIKALGLKFNDGSNKLKDGKQDGWFSPKQG